MTRKARRSVAKATTEVKFARSDRRWITENAARRQHQFRAREFNRASRRLGKAICREARDAR
jgi:hypothetical protein